MKHWGSAGASPATQGVEPQDVELLIIPPEVHRDARHKSGGTCHTQGETALRGD